MTWDSFIKLTIRINKVVLALGWLAFWGYGIAVGDIPPLSVLPGLLLMSLCIVLTVSTLSFVICHTWLYVRAKRCGDLPKVGKGWTRALIGGVFGFVLILLVSDSSGGAADAVIILVSILCSLCLIYGMIIVSEQYFRWHFQSSR